MKQGILIPVYRHAESAILLGDKLGELGLPIIIVDDGNNEKERVILHNWAKDKSNLFLIRLVKNSGKGEAVRQGLIKANMLGLSHVLQIDADGQHDINRAAFFLEESLKQPDKIICAYPEYDDSAPKSRVRGRKISNLWAAIVTLSPELKDVLCGFRVYPVEASLRITKNPFLDRRMGFDPEILVRLFWDMVLPVFYPIKIIYPSEGISNFHLLKDNLRISWMFTRLFFGMLIRLPSLILRHKKKSIESQGHWSRQKEKTLGYWHVKLLLILFRLFPPIFLRILAFPVGFFYFVFSARSRKVSALFLKKTAPFIKEKTIRKKCSSPLGSLRHIVSFSLNLVEKIQSWGGKFPFKNFHFQNDDIIELIQNLENAKGAFLICSHLGNAELLRALASYDKTGVSQKVKVTSIVNMDISANFIRMLKELNPHSALDIISANHINPDTAIMLEEKLSLGELAVIAGDRTSPNDTENKLLINFLGEEALFSRGAFYLAALMKAPVYFVFALRKNDLSLKPEYRMHVHKSAISFNDCSRKERIKRSNDLARSYAELLECYCKEKPFQWYNFYDFWSKVD